jgi:nucleotide-binding universal stress UspA family protein
MAPDHVLVPLDGSPLADDALVHALETFDCRTTVLNVVTPLDEGMSEGGVLDLEPDQADAERERTDRVVDLAVRRADEVDRSLETVVEEGKPAETILEYVENNAVDHVVMGGHGGDRHEITKRLLGTVATTVVSEAPVTVTVVR